MTSLIIGASKVEQIEQNIAAIENLKFSGDELLRIESILAARAIAS
jgi:L-glyceraldehyde 3-phosphate reductase